MKMGILVLALLLAQAPLAEFVSENNSFTEGYCILGCDAPFVSSIDGRLVFGSDHSCILSYDDSQGKQADVTVSLTGGLPDGTEVILYFITDGKETVLGGTFFDGICRILIEDVRSGADLEVSGELSFPDPVGIGMAVFAVGSDGYGSFLTIE